MRLVEKTSGEVLIDGTPIHDLPPRALRDFRRTIQIVFQDPYASLNPRLTIGDTLADCLRFHGIGTASSRIQAARDILDQVALGADYGTRYPHQLSGGQCQRVGIARALILEPRIVVLDEPVSALDVSVQAQILNLLSNLQRERDLTYLFISHDLNVVRHFCDRVGIMYRGTLVEEGTSREVFETPRHLYTAALVDAVLDVRSDVKLKDRRSLDDIASHDGRTKAPEARPQFSKLIKPQPLH